MTIQPSPIRPLGLALALVLGAAFAAACRRAPDPPETTPPPAAHATAPDGAGDKLPPTVGDPMFACVADTDCEVVEMGVCDVCNGGWLLSVRTGQADAARAKHAKRDEDPACTERGCRWNPTPICDAGECSRTMDFDGDAKTPAVKVANFSGER